MYEVADYGWMIADKRRMRAFSGALHRLITPDSIVVDIGTGTGIFALIAANLGARCVYAIDCEPVIGLAKKTATENGLRERIVFIEGDARRVEIPEPASVIISDIGGVLPWHGNNLLTLAHARRHLLATDGWMLPARDLISAAVVDAPLLYQSNVGVWDTPVHDIDLVPAKIAAANTMHSGRFSEDQLLSPRARVFELDYSANQGVDLETNFELVVNRAGTAHGITVWFDRIVAEGFEINNGPDRKANGEDAQTIYGHAFLSFPRPVPMSIDTTVSVELRATLIDEHYEWLWAIDISDAGRSARPAFSFRQSTGQGSKAYRRVPPEAGLRLTEDGEIARLSLKCMDDGVPLGGIAERLAGRFPRRFSSFTDALSYVAVLANKYC